MCSHRLAYFCIGASAFAIYSHFESVKSVLSILACPVPPLAVFEFLHRAMDIFEDYFHDFSPDIANKNAIVVYEVSNAC
jgi:hypothetical protein